MFCRRATNPATATRIRAVVSLLMLILTGSGITGCAGSKVQDQSPSVESVGSGTATGASSRQATASLAAIIAQRQIGVPYRYGGADTKGFDCSGLVYYSYANAGTQVARTTGGLWETLEPVARNQLRTGDVLFFDIEGKMSHVGLYLGQGRFVHAPASGRNVVVAELDSEFYRRALIRGGRTGP
jgi:murein DD-endopeptidase